MEGVIVDTRLHLRVVSVVAGVAGSGAGGAVSLSVFSSVFLKKNVRAGYYMCEQHTTTANGH